MQPIVAEATPNPRTIVFRTGQVHAGASITYRAGERMADPRVARLLTEFPEITDVLLARDFVSVSLRRPGSWEHLLDSIQHAVTREFVGTMDETIEAHEASGEVPKVRERDETSLAAAWRDLASLDPQTNEGLSQLLVLIATGDVAQRQVVANLLGNAEEDAAARAWAHQVHDPSRLVRRAAVDAIVDAKREGLRKLLEQATVDDDAWIRWKAVRGLADLGQGPSRETLEPLMIDPDFRVRLEAERALRET